MRPDDPPDHRPFSEHEGPRGFSDTDDGGYPIEIDLEPDTPPASTDQPEAHTTSRPASPISGRTLHNPLPSAPATVDTDDWYGPEPARAHRRLIIPIVVLIASTGLGIWLALPSPAPPQAPSATSAPDKPTRQLGESPAVRRTPPPTPTRHRTTAPKPTPTPKATRSSQPSKTTSRAPTRPPSTVTITTKVTITSRPSHAPSDNGPEEPPHAAPTTTPARTCLTWDDCHDDPPKG